MASITVCIPAYRSGKYLEKTLRSVQQQTHRELIVEIGLEPADDDGETRRICEAFLGDPRFSVVDNPEVLGWAQNIDSLLQRVETPYFTILPHDDAIHPEYLSRLVAAVTPAVDA